MHVMWLLVSNQSLTPIILLSMKALQGLYDRLHVAIVFWM